MSALEAIQAALGDLERYPDPSYTTLRRCLARHHGLQPDQVLPGNGAAELLTWACRDLTVNDAAVLLVPAFGDYDRSLQAFGVARVPCGLQRQECWLGTEAVVEALQCQARSYTRPALILNNPHNPTGRLFHRQELLPLLECFDPLVVDEAFMDFLPPDRQQSLIGDVASWPNLVVLRSQTKFYSLPGLRLGYALGDPERLERWRRWRDPWPVNSLAAAAAAAVLADTEFQQLTWRWLATARSQLYAGLQAIPGLQPLPGAANFFLVCCHQSVTQLQRALLRHHRILIRDCLSFPELGDHYFRVAVKTEPENQRLLTALAAELD